MIFSKRNENNYTYEEALFVEAKKIIGDIRNNIEAQTKENSYQRIKFCFTNYLKTILKENNILTEQETLHKLKTFNIDKTAIQLTENLLEYIIHIEYNHMHYSKEDLYKFLNEMENAVEEINYQRKAYHKSINENIPKINKNKIVSLFEKKIDELKKRFQKKGDLPEDLIINITEYYNYLPNEEKQKYSKDYHYYCKIMPELIELLLILEKTNAEFEKHQIIIGINKLFSKLDHTEREKIYPKISNFVKPNEQKFNLLLMFVYSHITNKDSKKAIEVYTEISKIYEGLDNNKKKYYHPIFLRLGNSIKKLQKQKTNSLKK